jgi:ornithine cyclodeaminase/alanine dehydrogenase-like protein (mu-crystallin family)
MHYIDDETARSLITHELAYECVAAALCDLSAGVASINPVVIGTGGTCGETYSVKSGEAAASGVVGVKVGSYWPQNGSRGLPRHASSVLLLDAETGLPRAFVEANQLNGFRRRPRMPWPLTHWRGRMRGF